MATASSSEFYLCPSMGCNRKYKTFDKFQAHVLDTHNQIVLPDQARAIEINKDNRKAAEAKRDKAVADKSLEDRLLAAAQRLEMEKEARFLMASTELTRLVELEKDKLRQQELEVAIRKTEVANKRTEAERLAAIRNDQLQIQEEINRADNQLRMQRLARLTESDDCCICTDKPRDTCVVPCGHKAFCHDCITKYHSQDPRKGCPICKRDIVFITKVFD